MTKEPNSDFLAESLRLCRSHFLTVALFSFCINLLMLSTPLYLLQIYDRVIPNRSVETLGVLTLVVVIAITAMTVLESIRSVALGRVGIWLDQQLGPHVLSGALARKVRKGAASASARDVRNVAKLRQFISGSYLIPLLDIPWTPVFIGALYILHPLIGTLTLVGALLLLALAYANELATRAAIRTANESANKVDEFTQKIISNADAVEAMGMRQNLLRRWAFRNQEALSAHRVSRRRRHWFTTTARLLRALMQIALLACAGWLILTDALTPGALIASMLLMRRAMAPIDRMISVWNAVVEVRKAHSRVTERLTESPSLRTVPTPALGKGGLSVSKLGFAYSRGAERVLKNVSFELAPGKVLGVVGPTAGGKSTLARLLVGLSKPSSGQIHFASLDMTRWDCEVIGPFVGYLPQSVALFDGTIGENIARMGDGADSAVVDAAKTAHVYDLIQRLPNGFDTVVGDRGVRLSGGQMQRMALAQAVFGKPKLVVLDEPDAHLDRDGRRALVKTIKALKKQGTMVVLISHSRSLLEIVDQTIRLNNGRIVASVTSNTKGKADDKP